MIKKNYTKDKTIMIFGAGINQLELIRAAHELGVTSVVIDPIADPPGKTEANYYYQVGGNDYEKTRAIALKHKVNGIVTGQTEKPLRMMAMLAQELDFIFHTPEVVENSLDKWLMKKQFMNHSVSCASGILLMPDEELNEKKISEFNFPFIIKPRDSYSSRGVYKVDSLNELHAHIAESRSWSSKGDVIIEEFLEGLEFSIETITWHGKTTIVQFTEKFITPYPNTVEMSHFQPAYLTNSEKKKISLLVISGINALGINNSAAHSEVKLTANGPWIIEIGARLGGDFIASYLTKASTGISLDMVAVQIALGLEPDLQQCWDKYSLIKYLELPVGKVVKEVLPLDDLFNIPGVVFVYVFVKQGDVIQPVTHSALRPACIIIEADKKDELQKTVQLCSEKLLKKIITN